MELPTATVLRVRVLMSLGADDEVIGFSPHLVVYYITFPVGYFPTK